MDITDAIAQLTAERDRIDRAIEALQAIDGSVGARAGRKPARARKPLRARKPARARKPRRTTAEFLSTETVLKLLTPQGDGEPGAEGA